MLHEKRRYVTTLEGEVFRVELAGIFQDALQSDHPV